MNGFPRLNEILDAVINDCYNFLNEYADQNTKKSIENTMKECKLTDDLLRKSYLLYCSIHPFDPTDEDNLDIIFFYKKYIYIAYNYYFDEKKDDKKIATLNDCCNAYLVLHGFRFECNGVLKENLYDFLYDKYECFSKLLAKYGISEIVKKHYEKNINPLKKKIKSHKKFVVELIRKLKSDISFQIISYIEDDKFEILQKEIKSLYKKIDLINIKNTIDKNELLENFIVNIHFNETNLDIDKKKIEYLNNNCDLLNNTIKNLSNPYNFNLWRKISNIILKNIFVILNKKNYTISQKFSKQILNELYKRQNEVKDNLVLYNKKVAVYKNNLQKQENDSKNNISKIDIPPAADKIRFFNLIIILKDGEYEIKPSLSIDFLFYLKENGNKLNHFNEELLDLILFDDINIDIRNEESIKPEEKKEEIGGENKILEKKYQGKINFKGDEIINMFNNPEKFLKKDINLDGIFQRTFDKMEEIKSKYGFKKKEIKISELRDEFVTLKSEIQRLISSYENYFIENGINYQVQSKIENDNLNEVDKENMGNYLQAKFLLNKVENKIVYYEEVVNDLKDLNDFKEYGISKVDQLIADDKNKMKNKAEVVSISNLFTLFKQDLKMKIIYNNEYQNYSIIFNNDNIDNFTINDFYSFLKENLGDYSFSIIKNDVTNFNFLVEVLSNFKQLKEIYNDDLDIKIE